jgi:hypothetical protein
MLQRWRNDVLTEANVGWPPNGSASGHLPTIEAVPARSFTAPQRGADEPKQGKNHRGNPQKVKCKSQSSKYQDDEQYQ